MLDVTAGAATGAVGLLVIAPDGEDFVLGRPDLALYVTVPAPGAALVRALQGGASLAEATAVASLAAGQDVDGADFLAGLADVGLLAEPGPATGGGGLVTGRRIRWVERIGQRAAGRLFGRVAWTGYGVATVFVLAALIARPDLRPRFEDTWFLGDPALAALTIAPIGLLLAATHELGHWLAGRALGVPVVFRVSRRGIWLVFESDLTHVVTLRRRQRYGPFLAGMAWDCSVLAAALALRLLYHADALPLPPIADRLLAVVVLTQVITLTWQVFAVFMRSDGYALAANALRCHNLYRASWLTMKDRLWRLTATEQAELAEVSDHDRRVAGWFWLGHLLGIAVNGWLLLNFGLLYAFSMALWMVNNIAGAAATSAAFWESSALLALLLVQVVGPPLFALRERRLRRAGVLL